jgi:hypothetical protein
VTLSRAEVALVKVVSNDVDPVEGTIAMAALTTMVITLIAVAPKESVAVKVSKYVPAGKFPATLRTTWPEVNVAVIADEPELLTLEKELDPVPVFNATFSVVVPVRPNVVVIVSEVAVITGAGLIVTDR